MNYRKRKEMRGDRLTIKLSISLGILASHIKGYRNNIIGSLSPLVVFFSVVPDLFKFTSDFQAV